MCTPFIFYGTTMPSYGPKAPIGAVVSLQCGARVDPLQVIWALAGQLSRKDSRTLQPYLPCNRTLLLAGQLSRKDSLARNLTRLQKTHPKEFSFFPRSWVLPAEYCDLKKFSETTKSKGRGKTYSHAPHYNRDPVRLQHKGAKTMDLRRVFHPAPLQSLLGERHVLNPA